MVKLLKTLGLLALLSLAAACGRVPSGSEGVLVNMYGSERGVDVKETGVGWVWVGPGRELYTFPTYTQNIVWTLGQDEGSRGDESISFQDRDGLVLNADIGLSYYVEAGQADELFVKYRRGIDEITDTYLRNMVRDALVAQASTLTAEEAYSTKKIALLKNAEEAVRVQVEPYGIKVEKLFWVGPIRLPKAVKAAVDGKIEATQLAQKKQNEVATAKAEADKIVEKARGDAESRKLAADAEAYSIQVTGEMLNKYPAMIRLREIQKWDGKYPTTLVGDEAATLLISP